MNFKMYFLTWWKGQLVGTDDLGNKYYEEKKAADQKKRWVMYNGSVEATKISPLWHGWLHYKNDAPLSTELFDWQKDQALCPKSKPCKKNSYTPWVPNA